jgi:hypothetical protein
MSPSMRTFMVLGFMLICLGAQGQSLAEAASWDHVQKLPLHTRVHVSTDGKSRLCSIDAVDETQLRCSAGHVVETGHYTFARGEIKSIKIARYPRSTLVGVGVGAAAGAITGLAINSGSANSWFHFSNGAVAGTAALIFAVPGGLVGLGTDFTRGPTVYRR